METRHYLLGAAFVVTMVASFYPKQDKLSEIVETTTRTSKARNLTEVENPAQTAVLNSREWIVENDTPDLFYVKPKVVEAPIQPKQAIKIMVVEPPPQPVAPPLPFTYLGKMIEEGKVIVYVAKAGRNYALKGGEVIDGTYAVQSIDAQRVVFNYIPIKTEQVLIVRGAN